MARVTIAVLLYNGPLLCGFDLPAKELRPFTQLPFQLLCRSAHELSTHWSPLKDKQ